ncbi:MAG TPA: hypothetical protein VLJ58_09465 [Ramlibacter sp.]|nr:hypothetical protein [Ramlibacter sp.]
MTNHSFRRNALGVAAGVLLLAACGGGGGGSDPVDPLVSGTDVPNSATTSAAGALAFARSVAASSDNSAEPLVLGDAVLATSETDEPDPSI